jgi:hypothetical protein
MGTRRVVALGLAVVCLGLAACNEVESEEAAGYDPATLGPPRDDGDWRRVTFTDEGARRIGLRMAIVRSDGGHRVVPYSSLIYDAEGDTWVYVSPKPLSFVRREVDVDDIEGDTVLLEEGPAAGTEVVEVGTAEVYGTELEVDEH